MSTVLLVGAFGQGNPGDEALCAAFCAALADHDVVVVSGDPVDTAAPPRRAGRRRTARCPLPACRVAPTSCVIAGGTIFKSLHPSTGRRPTALLRNAAAARRRRHGRAATKVAMVGVGADDLRGRSAQAHRPLARPRTPTCSSCATRSRPRCSPTAGAPTPFWIGADPAWMLAGDAVGGRRIDRPGGADDHVALSHLAGDSARSRNLAPADRPSGRHATRCTCNHGRSGAGDARRRRRQLRRAARPPTSRCSTRRRASPRRRPRSPATTSWSASASTPSSPPGWPARASSPSPTSRSWPGWPGGSGRSPCRSHASTDVLRGAVAHALGHEPVAAGRRRAPRSSAAQRSARPAAAAAGRRRVRRAGARRRARPVRRERHLVTDMTIIRLASRRRRARRRDVRPQLTVMGGQLAAGLGNLLFAVVMARVLAPGEYAGVVAFLALFVLLARARASPSAPPARWRPDRLARLRPTSPSVGAAVGARPRRRSASARPAARAARPASSSRSASPRPAPGCSASGAALAYGHEQHRRVTASLVAEPAVRLVAGVALALAFGRSARPPAPCSPATPRWLRRAPARRPVGVGGRRRPAGRTAVSPAPCARSGCCVRALAVLQATDLARRQPRARPRRRRPSSACCRRIGGAAFFATATIPLVLMPAAVAGGRTRAGTAAVALTAAVGVGVAVVGGAARPPVPAPRLRRGVRRRSPTSSARTSWRWRCSASSGCRSPGARATGERARLRPSSPSSAAIAAEVRRHRALGPLRRRRRRHHPVHDGRARRRARAAVRRAPPDHPRCAVGADAGDVVDGRPVRRRRCGVRVATTAACGSTRRSASARPSCRSAEMLARHDDDRRPPAAAPRRAVGDGAAVRDVGVRRAAAVAARRRRPRAGDVLGRARSSTTGAPAGSPRSSRRSPRSASGTRRKPGCTRSSCCSRPWPIGAQVQAIRRGRTVDWVLYGVVDGAAAVDPVLRHPARPRPAGRRSPGSIWRRPPRPRTRAALAQRAGRSSCADRRARRARRCCRSCATQLRGLRQPRRRARARPGRCRQLEHRRHDLDLRRRRQPDLGRARLPRRRRDGPDRRPVAAADAARARDARPRPLGPQPAAARRSSSSRWPRCSSSGR